MCFIVYIRTLLHLVRRQSCENKKEKSIFFANFFDNFKKEINKRKNSTLFFFRYENQCLVDLHYFNPLDFHQIMIDIYF